MRLRIRLDPPARGSLMFYFESEDGSDAQVWASHILHDPLRGLLEAPLLSSLHDVSRSAFVWMEPGTVEVEVQAGHEPATLRLLQHKADCPAPGATGELLFEWQGSRRQLLRAFVRAFSEALRRVPPEVWDREWGRRPDESLHHRLAEHYRSLPREAPPKERE